ncbi:MAG: CCA tRNA nucleotidyltransferase [Planctomycetes bacterium]|nr:CCA tRNA nucleotidyltransferase [Planctomycetota bacterium]
MALSKVSATKALAVKVINRLRQAGFEALLAGGCVRDMLMGRRPADYDVATNATPEEVKKLFKKVLMVGAKFGVAMVIFGKRRVEVTTFRSDLSYSNGRRPDKVQFRSTAREDALRRDFTINGMFYDPIAKKVIDYVGGMEDLKAGVIRAIGDPFKRFNEDYLRMLRAVRFAGRFGFRIEPATAEAIRKNASKITQISGERIREELEKIFAHKSAAETIRLLEEMGLAEAIIPELFSKENLWDEALERLSAIASKQDVKLCFAAMLCGLAKEQIRQIIRRWGGSNDLCNSICWISEHLHDWQMGANMTLAQLKRLLAREDFSRLWKLWLIDRRMSKAILQPIRILRERIKQIPPEKIAPEPFINGEDIKGLGLSEGPKIGEILDKVYEAQLNEQINTRRQALALARRLALEKS